MHKRGTFYGVGVGPGDPELLTLKASRVLQRCPVVAAPGKNPRETTAFQIALGACPFLEEKELAGIYMPMTKDADRLEAGHREAQEQLAAYLDQGKDVAFLTLGDPCIYSTYMYLHKRVVSAGYEAEIISGIPSFCAAAARLGITLGEKEEQIHILPASYDVEEGLALPGTKVLMKAGKEMPKVKALLERSGAEVCGAQNCTMEGEALYRSAEELPEDAGYYTLVFVREGEGR